jgi:hypothetical protein
MLAFGRPGEIDESTMREIAAKTGGKFFHALNEKALLNIFEKLSMEIHDDGVDEAALVRLAEETGGKYYPAKDVSKLKGILGEDVAKSLQPKEYNIKFASVNQRRDGTRRVVSLELVRRGQVVQREEAENQVRGVVVAEINHLVYLLLLVMLGVLLAVPPALRRLTRGSASA